MAMEYFCAYHGYLNFMRNLTDEECGRLFKACLVYSSTCEEPELIGNERFVFDCIRCDIDRGRERYTEKCGTNAENGKKGGRPKGNRTDDEKPNGILENQTDTEKPAGFLKTQKSQGKRKGEGKGDREGKGEGEDSSPDDEILVTNNSSFDDTLSPGGLRGESISAQEQAFEKFWELYPKKRSKGQAKRAWDKLNPSSEIIAAIMDKIPVLMQTKEWTKDGGQFIPYPATWLNASGWEDEVTPEQQEESSNIFLQLMKEGAFSDE